MNNKSSQRDSVPPLPNGFRTQQRQCQHQHQHQSGGGSNVQHQFTTLSNDRDRFNRERDEAQKELDKLVAEHQSVKNDKTLFIEKNSHAKSELGEEFQRLSYTPVQN